MSVPDKCFLCPASRDCMNLLMAHNILTSRESPKDPTARKAYEDLVQELNRHYPCGEYCPVETNEDVRKLIDRSIKFIRLYGLID